MEALQPKIHNAWLMLKHRTGGNKPPPYLCAVNPTKMKHLFILLFAAFALASCTKTANDGTVPAEELESTASFVASPDQDTAKYVPLYIHKIPAASELNSATTAVGGFGQILAPPMDRLEAQMLCKSYWVVEGYADNDGSRPQKIAGTGQWIRCFPNGTFYGGHWGRQTHAGAWYLDYTQKYPRLTLDSNVDRMDAIWEMQAIAGDQTEMAWVRLSDTNFGFRHRPISAKWIELYDMPTKEQFAGIHSGL